MVAQGATIVDGRPVRSWAAGHLRGAIAIPLRPQFGSWLGWLVPDERPLIVVLETGHEASEVVRQARTIGYERLAGVLIGNSDTWRAAGLAVNTAELVDAEVIDRPVLDVRQDDEYAAGHLPGSLHIELGAIAHHAHRLPNGPLATMCGHGERAATAASLLEGQGRDGVAVVIGGPDAWRQNGHQLEGGP